jgi:hypothetical protein
MSRWLPLALLTFGCFRNLELVDPQGEASTGSSTGSSSTTAADESSSSAADTSSSGSAGAEASTGTTTGESTGGPTGDPPDPTTDEPTPFCGDGVVNGHEECDDGDLQSDTCYFCNRVRLIFVTSILLQGGKINGIVSADAYCKSLANAAKNELPDSPIVDPGNFKALLATSTEGLERHFIGEGPYRLVNGLTVSRSFVELFTEPLEHPINVTERSETQHATVYTGFDIDGDPFPGIDFCGDWTDFNGTCNYGHSDAVDSNWVHAENEWNPSGCGDEQPIYCVEQE